uniref:Big-1 domain-containing protein n=1 Tax=Candidatus Methanogaster sp. ANME-2c ERB4 TaxID=2759911 RepID=A0A7G9YKM5_9EURY|nr:hypothetical protein JAJEHNPH_00018 [Methanosarcinales archaeon ANME-2c ERB4]QNO48934.1 hypothetical protein OEPDFBKK_00010 [Methanosarcinales archaeon ANME-2c ERB4]
MGRLKWHIILTLVLVIVFCNMANAEQLYVNESGWWRVACTFNTSRTPIQAAVDAAAAEDMIEVRSGTYVENVAVNKRLTLQSKGADVVTAWAENGPVNNSTITADTEFNVTSDDVSLTGNFSVDGWVNVTAIGDPEGGANCAIGSGATQIKGVIINMSDNILVEMGTGSGTLTLTICYTDTTLESMGLDADTLAIWKFNETSDKWEKMSGTTSENCVSVTLDHLCVFALAGTDIPHTSGHDPAPGATGTPIDTNITVHVLDDGKGVNVSMILMTVNDAVVTPDITGATADYTLTYDPPTDFNYAQLVKVTIDAADLNETPNEMATDEYLFTTESAPMTVTAVPTSVIRGTATEVTFTVTSEGSQVEGALVKISECGVDGTNGTTDENGTVTISITATSAGTIVVTATKDGYDDATTTVGVKARSSGGGGSGTYPPGWGDPAPTSTATSAPTTAAAEPTVARDAAQRITPSDTPSDTPDLSEIVEDELKKLAPGLILFNPPKKMRVGVRERVEVRISKNVTEDLSTGLKGRGEPQIENISVSTFMKVHLTGDNFDIKPLSEVEQVVSDEGFTQWEYDVIPNKHGNQILQLKVTARIKIPDGEEQYSYPVLERDISVKVNPIYSITHFIEIHWQWIVGAIIGSGIFTLIVEWRRRQKK